MDIPGDTVVSLQVEGGLAFIAYALGGIHVFDVVTRVFDVEAAPSLVTILANPVGVGPLVRIVYRGGVLACAFASGSWGTLSVLDPLAPKVLGFSWSSGTSPTALALFARGILFIAHGLTAALVELPPLLAWASPGRDGGCPGEPLRLAFTTPLDAASVNTSTVRVTRDGLAVPATATVDGRVITITLGAGSGRIEVHVDGITSRRGTALASAERIVFDLAPACLAFSEAPTTVFSGTPMTLAFSVVGPEPELAGFLYGPIDSASSTWSRLDVPATSPYSATFLAPSVSSATLYAARPFGTWGGAQTTPIMGPLRTFLVLPEPCSLAPRCDDGAPCTDDGCVPFIGCTSVVDDTNTCSDGDACTGGDRCVAGSCRSTSRTTCEASPCESAACNPSTGQCESVVLPDRTLCEDLDPGTAVATCIAGECQGILPTQVLGELDLTALFPTSQLTRLIRRVVQVGGYAYLALEVGGLVILDVSDPEDPTPVGLWSLPERDGCTDLAVDAETRTAYLACGASSTCST